MMHNSSTSLSSQAAQLKRSIQNREKRRNHERNQRAVNAEDAGGVDVYDEKVKRRATGPKVAATAAIATLNAISASSNLPVLLRCELCQATFTSDAQHQQHLISPVHRKALDKQAEAQAKRERLGRYADVAEAALGAAAWQATHGSTGTSTAARPSSRSAMNQGIPAGGPSKNQQPHSQQQTVGGHPRSADAQPSANRVSHEELVALARQETQPLSIDGWVPPSVPQAPIQPAFSPSETSSEEEGSSAAEDYKESEAVADKPAVSVPNEEEDAGGGLGLVCYSDDEGSSSSRSSGSSSSLSGAGSQPLQSFF